MNDPGLSKLLRCRSFVCLILLLILSFNFAIRWRLRDMPLERDEGEYAYAGQLLLHGIPPYQLAYNMKFPGVYFSYAVLMAAFGQSTAGIHIGLILITSITAILVFLIGCELSDRAGALLAMALYVCLAALPGAAGLAAHATHFVSLFVCAGMLAALYAQKQRTIFWLLLSGIAFGLAILMVQQAAAFPLIIFGWLLWKGFRRRENPKSFVAPVVTFCVGCMVPLLIAAAGLACAGVWNRFAFWTFYYAWHYASILPLRAAPAQFIAGFGPVFTSGIFVWIGGLAGLLCLIRIRAGNNAAQLTALMFLAAMIAACPGFYFRNHYFLMAMPWLALLNSILFAALADAFKNPGIRCSECLAFCLWLLLPANLLFENSPIWFKAGPMEASRILYGTNPFEAAIPVAAYLKSHTTADNTIGIIGSEPEIFFLSDRHSASGYIYLYSLTEPQPLAPQMRNQFLDELQSARPKYIVFINLFSSWYSVIVPESFRSASQIQDWWTQYSTNYVLSAAAHIPSGKPVQFFEGPQLLALTNTANEEILIYGRKP